MIVRSVLGLGKSLDIPVLAEGVETLQQLEFLHSAACEEVQGFYFGRAASAEQIHKIIASGYAQVQTLAEDLPAPEEISPRGKLTPIAGGKTGAPRPLKRPRRTRRPARIGYKAVGRIAFRPRSAPMYKAATFVRGVQWPRPAD